MSGHFLDRRDTRVEGRLDIPFADCVKAAQRYPNQRCRTLVNDGKYWVFFKWKPNKRQLVILSVLPRDYFLPYPGLWVKTQ